MTDDQRSSPVEKPEVVETFEREDGHTIARYKSGALYDVTAGKIARGPNHAIFTQENANEMRQRAVDSAMRAKVRAFAREMGKDPDMLTDDQLLESYGDAQEAIHRKAYQLFMEAKTPRAAEGLYLPLQRLPGEAERGAPVFISNVVAMSDEVAKAITELHARLMSGRQDPSPLVTDILEGRIEPLDKE